ncbi:MAG: VCBS repeat-containing protein [Deltaproteobacteria bacterium]|nr:VCBS repeat-containing protein [Deltaproteobacteria bacterium]
MKSSRFGVATGLFLLAAMHASCSSDSTGGGAAGAGAPPSKTYPDGSIEPTASCVAEGGTSAVQSPVLVHNLKGDKSWAETGWFSSPAIVKLDTSGKSYIVAPFYSLFVFDSAGTCVATIKKDDYTQGRIYAPAVIADLDGDGVIEVVAAGGKGTVGAYEWKEGTLKIKEGWPASTSCGGESPENRGMAAADLDGDGKIEVVVTTTNTSDTGSQVFVFSADGKVYQPAGVSWPAWPRYNTLSGPGGDADANGMGHHGYGCYGLNVGIGNIDDDAQLEILATYDNHHINAFKPDGTSIKAAPYFTNRDSKYKDMPLDWGQFIRWYDPAVEEQHYHLHQGDWPDVNKTMWLQWTASPPSVGDIDGDGKNEVVGFPNAEMKEPYETQGFALMVLQGAHGDGSRSAMRMPGFENLPMSGKPAVRESGDWYPPDGVPSPVLANILGDSHPEILASLNDGAVYAYGSDAQVRWSYNFAGGAPKTFASEPVVADLNKDGRPEIIFGTYSLSENGGHLIILDNTGALLFDITLQNQAKNGNGIGVPAAPAVGDLDGDGTLEIALTSFDHGLDIYNVPGSGTGCQPWPTGRGNTLRNGQGYSYVK